MFDCNLIGILGEFGSGKSLSLLERGIATADRDKKGLTLNFVPNQTALLRYCVKYRYDWVAHLIRTRSIYIVEPFTDGIEAIFARANQVILLDEAGIYLNSRNWAKHSQQFLSELFQSRHNANILVYACHFQDQVDKQLRLVTQYWVVCRGRTRASQIDGRPRLVSRWFHEFKPEAYNRWQQDLRAQHNPFMTRKLATKNTLPKIIGERERDLFECYDSFGRPGSDRVRSYVGYEKKHLRIGSRMHKVFVKKVSHDTLPSRGLAAMWHGIDFS